MPIAAPHSTTRQTPLWPQRAAVLLALATGACTHAGGGGAPGGGGPRPAPFAVATTPPVVDTALTDDIRRAIESRLADLRDRGGECAAYGEVLERAYREGRITLRPYMWRVGTRLTAGMARLDGTMTLAREIDSLNVGVRTPDDVVWSMEHEAVHVTFRIPSWTPYDEEQTDAFVRTCRSPLPTTKVGIR